MEVETLSLYISDRVDLCVSYRCALLLSAANCRRPDMVSLKWRKGRASAVGKRKRWADHHRPHHKVRTSVVDAVVVFFANGTNCAGGAAVFVQEPLGPCTAMDV